MTQDDKVISVRLALFAEMVKEKPWAPATLRAVGGTEGVGLTFLEETFSSPQANPRHRLHRKGAQAVLKSLLPDHGTTIKGQMRPEAMLWTASGYADRSRDFADLIHILDHELHLITPADSDEATTTDEPAATTGLRHYQLTHDYLVHSLDGWLTRKQRETRRGRAELCLAERSASWNAKPENRQLPSAWEWTTIRILTKRKDWSELQHRMMKRARRVNGLRSLGVVAGLVALIMLGIDFRRRVFEAKQETFAIGLVERVVQVNIAQVPNIVTSMAEYRRWVDPLLHQRIQRFSRREFGEAPCQSRSAPDGRSASRLSFPSPPGRPSRRFTGLM